MHVVYEPVGERDSRRDAEDARREGTLATHVEVADSLPAKMRGLRFRHSLPDDHALLFPFDRAGRRDVDMLFVPFPIDVLWLVEGRVERVKTLRPWIGFGLARADTVVELSAGAADAVVAGDRVRIEDGSANGGV